MLMQEKSPLATWLDNKYIEWMKQQGGRRTIIEFADHLGVDRSMLSYWMNDRREPSDENVLKIAVKLGYEIYDLMGKKRPNPRRVYANRNWDQLPEKIQRQLVKTIAKHSKEPIPDEIAEDSPPKRK
jgi:transcriptional regulator with XRE-family HTH domain